MTQNSILKYTITLIFLFSFLAIYSQDAQSYLNQIPGFNNPSFFKKDIYRVCHSFDEISTTDAANQIVKFDSFDLHLMNACLFFATNKAREKYKKKPLKINESVTKGASLWAAIMAKEKFVGHIHPTRSEVKSPELRMKIFESNLNVSENCAFTIVNRLTYIEIATRAIEQWLSSSGHKRNMLSYKWEYMGCGAGISKYPDNPEISYIYFVQNFY